MSTPNAKGLVKPMADKKATHSDFEQARSLGMFRRLCARVEETRAQSFEESLEKVWMGLCALLGYPWADGVAPWYVEATFDDRVIVEKGYQLLAYPLSWSADGAPVFGEPVAVEVQYVPVAASDAAGGEAASGEARWGDLELDRLRMELGG